MWRAAAGGDRRPRGGGARRAPRSRVRPFRRGRREVVRAAFLAAVLASTYTVLDAGFESLSVELVGGLGVVNGVQRAEVVMTDGEPVVSRSAFTDVFVPTESGWRIRVARSVELEAWPGSGKEDGGRRT